MTKPPTPNHRSPNPAELGPAAATASTTASQPRPAPSWRWPAIVVGMLMLHASFCGVTLYYALHDRTFAVEDDYYARAVDWDTRARERDLAIANGWTMDWRLTPGEPVSASADDAPTTALELTLLGRDAVPLRDAAIKVFARCHGDPSRNTEATLQPGATPGTYTAPIAVNLAGVWDLRFEVLVQGYTVEWAERHEVTPAELSLVNLSGAKATDSPSL